MKVAKVTLFEKQLEELEHLLTSPAYHDYQTLIAWFRKISVASDIDALTLKKYVNLMVELLDYKPKQEQTMVYGYTTANHIRACAAGQLERLTSDEQTAKKTNIACDKQQALEILQPYLDYVVKRESRWKQDWLIYKVFKYGQLVFQEVFEAWVLRLEQREIRPENFLQGVKDARLLEALDVIEKPWQLVEEKLLPLFDHDHYMLRAAAAKKLGEYYTEADTMETVTDVSLRDMLAFVAKKERELGAVAGGFIDGLAFSINGLYCLTATRDNGYAHQLQGFDAKRWALDVLKVIKHPEAPNVQSFKFHIHEFFDRDAEAIYEMIEMDKLDLALMTATETVCDEMKPVLERLSEWRDADIAGRAKEWLRLKYQD